LKLFKQWKDTLNVKLNPPGGGSKSLLMRESLRFNWFIKNSWFSQEGSNLLS